MDCNQVKEYLIDAVAGAELPAEAAAHLSACAACRREKEEIARVWAALDPLAAVRFPRRLSRSVLRRVAAEEGLPRFSPRRLIFAPPAALWRAGLAAAAAAAAVLIIQHAFSPREDGLSDQVASTYRAKPASLPDLSATLNAYLLQAEVILSTAARGGYPRWGDVFREIFRGDMEGQARYLLDRLAADAPARPAVQAAHETLWALLQAGRGKEGEAVSIPEGVDLHLTLREIRGLGETAPER